MAKAQWEVGGIVSERLPKLAVVTDVPVERVFSGGLLLYRLLAAYPKDRLLIVQSCERPSEGPAVRLPGVTYRYVKSPLSQLFVHRFNPLWPLTSWASTRFSHEAVLRATKDFVPEAILSVLAHFLCFPAAALARRLQLPLHLIVHDDWPNGMINCRSGVFWQGIESIYRRICGQLYRQAAQRYCVSPGMVELCQAQYGPTGTVLYPNRGEDSPIPRLRTGRLKETNRPVVAFAGSLLIEGARNLLRSMVEILKPLGGHLDLYSPPANLAQLGLLPPVVRWKGFLPPREVAERVAESAHALFLPASFYPGERTVISTLFPSKLADYTAIGIPIIIWGPDYSSAARWGLQNPNAAITCTTLDPNPVKSALLRILNDSSEAASLGLGAVAAGSRDFDLVQARRTLYGGLADSNQRPVVS